jgi:drug/metabolite transporter (DMT)-like permease
MWILFALIASVLWGLTYVLNEQIYKRVSILTSLGITTFVTSIVILLIAFFCGLLKPDLVKISSSKGLLLLIIGEVLIFTLAELSIGYSIINKNATLAGLIEISYPIFITIFAYILFKKNQINLGTVIGGILIFLGIIIIYQFNK